MRWRDAFAFVLKHLSRGWVRSVLWVVLLTAGIGFFTVSAGQWNVSRQNLATMDEVFTTVAVVDDIGFWRSNEHLSRLVGVDGHVIRSWGVDKTGDKPDPEIAILEQAASLKMIEVIDNRQSSRHFLKIFSCRPSLNLWRPPSLGMRRINPEIIIRGEGCAKYGQAFDDWVLQEGISSVVLVAKCISLNLTTSMGSTFVSYTPSLRLITASHWRCILSSELKYVEIRSVEFCPHEYPFTVGKEYLLATADLSPNSFT